MNNSSFKAWFAQESETKKDLRELKNNNLI